MDTTQIYEVKHIGKDISTWHLVKHDLLSNEAKTFCNIDIIPSYCIAYPLIFGPDKCNCVNCLDAYKQFKQGNDND